jgi:hypothetical protein
MKNSKIALQRGLKREEEEAKREIGQKCSLSPFLVDRLYLSQIFFLENRACLFLVAIIIIE